MAIYWIDPYIDAAIGGIHGTVNGTTKDGSYSYPFSLSDFYTLSSSTITAVNGVTFSSGDEIRIKGMPLTDFYMDIDTTGNLVTRTGTNSGYMPFVDSSAALDIVRSDLAGRGWQSAVMIYHDPGLYGSNNDYLVVNTYTAFVSETGNGRISTYDSSSNFAGGYFRAKNGVASGRDTIAFLNNDYVLDQSDTSGSANMYLFNFAQTSGITITDGWTSSVNRAGVTIIAIGYYDYNNSPYYLYAFSSNGSNGTKNTTVFDLRNTSLLLYARNHYACASRVYMYLKGYTGESDSYFKMRQWADQGTSAWSYAYFDTSSSIATDYTSIDFGIYGRASYVFLPTNTGFNRFNIDNVICGRAPYSNNDYYKIDIGNVFVRNQYSGNAIWYHFYSHYDASVSGHIFGFEYLDLFTDRSSTTELDFTGSTIYSDANPNYPGTGSGPSYGGEVLKTSNAYTQNLIPLTANHWYDNVAVSPYSRQTWLYNSDYGVMSTFVGKLVCNGVDYRTADVNILTKQTLYNYDTTFVEHDFSICNDYDNNIISLFTAAVGSTGQIWPSLICYNDNPDELTVQCNSDTRSYNYTKPFSVAVEGGRPAANKTLTVSVDIEFSHTPSNNPMVYGFPGDSGAYAFTETTNGNVRTYTFSTSTNNYNLTDHGYFGLKVRLRNTGNPSDRYYIRNMSATVA